MKKKGIFSEKNTLTNVDDGSSEDEDMNVLRRKIHGMHALGKHESVSKLCITLQKRKGNVLC